MNNKRYITCNCCHKRIVPKTLTDFPIMDGDYNMCRSCFDGINMQLALFERTESNNERTSEITKIIGNIDNVRPHAVKNYLDQYIINQDKAKKTLAVAVYNHFKRMQYIINHPDAEPLDKSNVIMLGPSGCGKTALLSRISKMLDIPFAITDSSSLTEAGFVGSDVEVAVRNLYYAADQDVTRAEFGIIYLDEFDKIARKSGENNSITCDPGHEGVQQSILKMLEGNVVEFTERGQRKHPEAQTIKIDTTNILFIVGGAFVGIDKIIEKRVNKTSKSIGFGATTVSKSDKFKYNELIHQTKPEDLMKFGIIPEVLGRLPIICTLEELDENALIEIMTSAKNSPIYQYTELLKMDNVTLEFTDAALRAIAHKAIERKTGARSLKGIIEDVMLNIMFDIPQSKENRRITITEDCINLGSEPEIIVLATNAA